MRSNAGLKAHPLCAFERNIASATESNALNTRFKRDSLAKHERTLHRMDRQVTSLFGLLILLSLTPAKAQLDSVLIQRGIMQLCPNLPYLSDSIAIRSNLDSIATLMSGHWSLQLIESGWTAARKPEKVVELIVDRQGRGDVYEDGQLVASIQLVIRRVYAMVRFDLRQEGRSIIKLSVSKQNGGHLGVCEEKLFLSDGYADGTLYAFRRMR